MKGVLFLKNDSLLEAAKAIAKIITRNKYEAYIFGEKCHAIIHNENYSPKIKAKIITILTNANLDDIQKFFPRSEKVNNELIVNFANENFKIISFIDNAKTLNEDRMKRDFTINVLAQNIDDEIEDFKFKYNDKIYSSINDIKNKKIRIIGNPQKRIKEDPSLIMKALTLVSRFGYSIEPNTLLAIKESIKLLKNIPVETMGLELRKIITGKYLVPTLMIMQKFKIFGLRYLIDDKKEKFFSSFNNINFEILKGFDKPFENEFEIWATLLDTKTIKLLQTFKILNEEHFNIVKWLIDNQDIYDFENDNECVKKIYKSILPDKDIHHMKYLILQNNHKYEALNQDESAKEKTRKVLFWLCARPYYVEQIELSDEEINLISNNTANILKLKQNLLKKLTFVEHYPRPMEIYKSWLPQALREEGYEFNQQELKKIADEKEAEENSK